MMSVVTTNRITDLLPRDPLPWSQQCLRAIVGETPQCVKLISREGTLLQVNPGCLSMLGCAGGTSPIGRPAIDLVSPEYKEQWQRFHERICRGEKGTFEYEMMEPCGQRRFVETHAVPIRLDDGCIAHLGITRDVTQRRRAEDQSRVRADQAQALAAIGQTALGATDVGAILSYAVRSIAQTLRVPLVAAFELHRDGRSLLLRDGLGWNRGRVGAATIGIERRSPGGLALRTDQTLSVSDLSGDRRFTPTPLLVEHDVVSGILAPLSGWLGVLAVFSATRREFSGDEILFLRSVANIIATAMRNERADRARRDGEQRLRAILDTAAEGIITIDDRGTVESVNAAACRLFGYASREVVGRKVTMLMPEERRRVHDRRLVELRHGRGTAIPSFGREVVGRRADGTQFPLELSVSQFEVSGRRMYTGVLRDISERRRLEREVLEVGAEERRRVGQDLHDGLCQHLTGIAFALEVLGRKLESRSAPETPGIRKIGELVDQAITQARELAHGLQPVTLEAAGLSAALARLAQNTERIFAISCLFVCDDSVLVHDNLVATHLYRITQEAINNAVQHGKAKTILVDLTSHPRELRLSISDDGVGLGNAPSDNTGMGLQTMEYRARLIGGSFEVSPACSGGTRVTCVLPTAGEPTTCPRGESGLRHAI
jgi:PAS domain S-box-containing protein